MLRFECLEDYVEIDIICLEEAPLPSRGDARIAVGVSAAGFIGHNDLWVLGETLESFCKALVELERNRRGKAVLNAISPQELHFEISAIDLSGHMAINGSTGYFVQRENSRFWHSVSFGLEFDPSQLVKALNQDWVKNRVKT